MISFFQRSGSFILALIPLLCFSSPSSFASPTVVVSIKPLHSLVSFIMQDVGTPRLLITDNQSVHDYQIRPSQRRLLAKADMIIYASNHVETFIPALQKSLKDKTYINLSAIKNISLLDARSLNHSAHGHRDKDGHIWLSIDNALRIAQYISQRLTQDDPQHTAVYQRNLTQLQPRLLQLKQHIERQLKPLQDKPYLIFHDAFQYFEQEFHLSHGYYVTTSADHKMGIKYIAALKRSIRQQNIHCVYYEPPHIPKLINTLTSGQAVKLRALDPLAVTFKPGPDLYFKHIQHIADQFQSCLNSE